MGTHIFPSEYYNSCQTNSEKRGSRWFCNRSLSPHGSANEVIEMNQTANNDSSNSFNVENGPDFVPDKSNESSDLKNICQDSNDNINSDCVQDSSNSFDVENDPDFIPDTSDESSGSKNILCQDSNDNIINSDCGQDSSNSFDVENDPDFIPDTSDESSGSKNICQDSNDNIINSDCGQVKECEENIGDNTEEMQRRNLGEYKINGEKRKGNKKKDFCFFCHCYVLNFARHIIRCHSVEVEVQQIISLSPKNKKRRQLLSTIRRKGNFLNSNVLKKPIRRGIVNRNILPCTNCKGFFSSSQLWRHRKLCMGISDRKHKANAQNLLLKDLRVDQRLKNEVFPGMRPDDISLVAKCDDLICAFGTRYLKSHREKHFVNVTSRKMRELARLLIALKEMKPSINNLFEALRPENFGDLISATKVISKYNENTDNYEAASTAMNMGTTLKQCCQLAIVFVMKKNMHFTVQTATIEADLKTLIQLIESEWRFEISTQAANDLNIKKWNKLTMVPLASDLKILRDYLIFIANKAADDLINNEDQKAYVTLLETVFCKLLLLNRRRPGELQRLPLHIYTSVVNEDPSNYQEFNEILTKSEKILLTRFKRIVIRGKRGRGVPVLVSTDVQAHIDLLLKYRDKFINERNNFLFGMPNNILPLCGYKTIKKYAHLSGTKNPQAITATRLRKHLATLTQVLNMSEGDIEQLCTFMGHTVNVHRGSYRLPDDVFQTAKISKLLLLMEQGQAGNYKGKNLDEIDVDITIDNNSNDEEFEPLPEYPENNYRNLEAASTSSHNKISKLPGKTNKIKRTPWTDEQKK